MSQKIKRKFLIAAQGNPEWFRAVSLRELAQMASPGEGALFADAPLKDARVLSAPDNYNLLHMAVECSPGVKKDLAEALAAEIAKTPLEMVRIIEALTERELSYRSDNLNLDVAGDLLEYVGETEYDALIGDLAFLRTFPNTSYHHHEALLKITADLQAANDVFAVAQDADKRPDEKQKVIESLLINRLDGATIIAWADLYGFYYGDKSDLYDGPYPEEEKVYFDVTKTLMQHWDEAGKTLNGKPYDAFTTGKESRRAVFLRSEFVQKLKPGV